MACIRAPEPGDRGKWLRMRRALWDDCPDDQQVREMGEILASDTEEVFVAERPGGGLCGFVEAAVRPWAIGCGARRGGAAMWIHSGSVSRATVPAE